MSVVGVAVVGVLASEVLLHRLPELTGDDASPVAVPVSEVSPLTPRGFLLEPDSDRGVSVPGPTPFVSASPPSTPPARPDELKLVRGARSSLAILDEHDATFPNGALTEDVEALRIEALSRGGATRDAAAASARFLDTYPNSAYAERVQGIRSASSP